jgi:multiple sugar transport system permease protein
LATALPSQTIRSSSRRFNDQTIAAMIALAPWVIGFLAFTLWPVASSVYFSFTKYNVIKPAEWVGLDNYRRLLTDDTRFAKSVQNSLIYTALYVPLHVGLALAIALLLNQARRLQGIYRTLYYLPSITPAVATAYLWLGILNPNDGLVNRFLRFLHVPAPMWTVDPLWIKPAIVMSQIWLLGGAMIIFLAGLKDIPITLYEAARIDGANAWQRFTGVTLPMLSGVIFFVTTISLINALQVFTQGYVMFDKDGGPGNAGLFVVMYLFKRAFEFFQMGYASAIAWLLFLIIVAITFVQFRLSRRWVFSDVG